MPAPAASAPVAPADAAAALAAQAEAQLQQLLAQMLQRSQAASDAANALRDRIQREQTAATSGATARRYHVFAVPDETRLVALRDVAELNGHKPLDPQPCTLDEAMQVINATLHDPLLEPDPPEVPAKQPPPAPPTDAVFTVTAPPPPVDHASAAP